MQNTKSTPLNQLFLILTINKLQRKLRKQPHIQELPKRTKYSEIKQVVTLKTIKYLWKKLKKTLINEDTLSSRIKLPTVVKTSQSSLQIQCSSSSVSCSVMSDSLQPHSRTLALQVPLSMGFSSKNTGLDWHSLLQRIFLTQGPKPGLLHSRQILYHLNYREDSMQSLSKSKGFLD